MERNVLVCACKGGEWVSRGGGRVGWSHECSETGFGGAEGLEEEGGLERRGRFEGPASEVDGSRGVMDGERDRVAVILSESLAVLRREQWQWGEKKLLIVAPEGHRIPSQRLRHLSAPLCHIDIELLVYQQYRPHSKMGSCLRFDGDALLDKSLL